MKTFALALLVATAASYKLTHRFVSGLSDTETDDESSFNSIVADAVAQSGSGVRAAWVELPDCARGPLKKGELAL